MSQKGFSPILAIFLIGVVTVVGYFILVRFFGNSWQEYERQLGRQTQNTSQDETTKK